VNISLKLLLVTKRIFVRVRTQDIIEILNPTKIRTNGYILHSALMLRRILGNIPRTRILFPCNLVFWTNKINVHISSIKLFNNYLHLLILEKPQEHSSFQLPNGALRPHYA